MVSPSQQRQAVQGVVKAGLCPPRRACRYLGIHRSSGTIPTKAQGINPVWSGDFISDRTDNGGKLRILSSLDEYTRECRTLHVARQLTAADLVIVLEELVAQRGSPAHIRSDNGRECVARTLQAWLAERQVKDPLHRTGRSPWQNGHVESFHGSLRDACLDRELMLSVAEARVVIEDYRRHYHEARPHGGIDYRPPQAGAQRRPGLSRQSGRHQPPPLDLPTKPATHTN